ncbi:hypothetical protein [Mycolicibacterium pallens]|uniref:Uncharacterized protein n=1 Tax=Mycolicibacterium pallens TaxID=370524 RepID=A0ABX8VLK9_9MYCO|nr:hypothetical protein [Mycolicibacterium pallens]QYL18671.1 hypothetical protein K0O64_09350 [Mycolicibacterium pallens]
MSGVLYTHEELAATIEAEAATLDPDQWVGGWNLTDYLIEAMQAGIITRINHDEDVDYYS